MSKPSLCDITTKFMRETEKAICVSDDGTEKNAVWLPRSQIEINDWKPNGIMEITMPEWLAKDKGLI